VTGEGTVDNSAITLAGGDGGLSENADGGMGGDVSASIGVALVLSAWAFASFTAALLTVLVVPIAGIASIAVGVKGFLDKDSGLPSNFLNQVKAVDNDRAWFSTDKGLAYYDGVNWSVYRSALDTHLPEMTVRDAAGAVTKVAVDSAPSHNYILGMDFQGDDIWVATAHGLSHGIRIRTTKEAGTK